ncbi:MAG: ChaN family lipoprotein [Bacteroidetes bacterium]|nr:ChaN family lipoprotein [Bacteroidota bacterium]
MTPFRFLALAIIVLFCVPAVSQLSEKNYKIFSVRLDKEVTLQEIIDDMNSHDVLFFGEEHNDSVGHYLENKILEMLFMKFNSNLTLSMEMFERDVQPVMNEYLKGFIREKNFNKDTRIWSNYRDYKPLVEFSKLHQLDVICANSPARYTNLAGRKGQQALMELPKESKKFFAPLPYDTATGKYFEKLEALSGHGPASTDTSKTKTPSMSMGSFNLILAQSLWDATMAYSIADYQKKNKSKKIMQVNGRFHSDEGFAVVTQLKKYNSKLKPLVISTGSEDSFPNINWNEYKKLGDYIIITDPNVPRTYKD